MDDKKIKEYIKRIKSCEGLSEAFLINAIEGICIEQRYAGQIEGIERFSQCLAESRGA